LVLDALGWEQLSGTATVVDNVVEALSDWEPTSDPESCSRGFLTSLIELAMEGGVSEDSGAELEADDFVSSPAGSVFLTT
jgi:hypothetical protein